MKHAQIIGPREDVVIGGDALKSMLSLGGKWTAYQNHDLGHSELGCLRFLAFGEGRTFSLPPSRYPDTPTMIGWRYQLVGEVDFTTSPPSIKNYDGELFSTAPKKED